MHSRTQPSKDYVDLLSEYKELHKDSKNILMVFV